METLFVIVLIISTVIHFYIFNQLYKDLQRKKNIIFDNYVESQTRIGYVWRSIQDYETADYVNRKGAYQEIDRNWQRYIKED